MPWCVSSAPDGIRFPPTFFDQMVIKQTHRNEALLQCGIGEPYAGIDRDNVWAAAIGPDGQIAHILGDLGAASCEWIGTLTLADREVIGETACVRLDRAGRQA